MDFLQALKDRARQGKLPVIPDIKRFSPKEGDLLRGRDPVELAGQLAGAGAPVLSVVTEERHFGGSLALLSSIAGAVSLPVLRKDFITTREQVRETARAGAKAVLLIVSMLEQPRLEALLEEAGDQGLDALVETHSPEEIRRVNPLAPGLVGINNRNILELERDGGGVDTTEDLVRLFTGSPLIVSESAIHSPPGRRPRQGGRSRGGAGGHRPAQGPPDRRGLPAHVPVGGPPAGRKKFARNPAFFSKRPAASPGREASGPVACPIIFVRRKGGLKQWCVLKSAG